MTPRMLAILCAICLWSAQAAAQVSEPVLSLSQAILLSRAHQPQLKQARARYESSDAAADAARAPLLPQVTGTASVQRTTANFVPRPGVVPAGVQTTNRPPPSNRSFNFYNFGVSASQLIYDFGQGLGSFRAAKETARALKEETQVSEQAVLLAVRTAFFEARASKALVTVAREALENQERHLAQAKAFVEVGTRPEIELAQVRTDVANARVQLIRAENGYEIAKARLNQAIGRETDTQYDVADETLPSLSEEDQPIDQLLSTALKSRPELKVLALRVEGQKQVARSERGGYGPSLSAIGNVTEGGTELDDLTWNWNAGLFLTWPLLEGGVTPARTREARANLALLRAQVDELRQRVRFELEQARLAVRAAKAVVEASDEALLNAKDRLKLAEGRYAAGVGNAIELGDAQLALSDAGAQRVRAEYELSAARASLLSALGKPG